MANTPNNAILSNDTQDLIKSALGTPAAQQQVINALLDIQYSQLDPTLLQQATVTLTSAQILALNTTPVVVLPAPGAGYTNVVLNAYATLNFNSVAYTGSNALQLQYTNGSGTVVGSFASSFLDASANAAQTSIPTAVACAANAAVVASVPNANPAAGNSTVTLYVAYRVLPF